MQDSRVTSALQAYEANINKNKEHQKVVSNQVLDERTTTYPRRGSLINGPASDDPLSEKKFLSHPLVSPNKYAKPKIDKNGLPPLFAFDVDPDDQQETNGHSSKEDDESTTVVVEIDEDEYSTEDEDDEEDEDLIRTALDRQSSGDTFAVLQPKLALPTGQRAFMRPGMVRGHSFEDTPKEGAEENAPRRGSRRSRAVTTSSDDEVDIIDTPNETIETKEYSRQRAFMRPGFVRGNSFDDTPHEIHADEEEDKSRRGRRSRAIAYSDDEEEVEGKTVVYDADKEDKPQRGRPSYSTESSDNEDEQVPTMEYSGNRAFMRPGMVRGASFDEQEVPEETSPRHRSRRSRAIASSDDEEEALPNIRSKLPERPPVGKLAADRAAIFDSPNSKALHLSKVRAPIRIRLAAQKKETTLAAEKVSVGLQDTLKQTDEIPSTIANNATETPTKSGVCSEPDVGPQEKLTRGTKVEFVKPIEKAEEKKEEKEERHSEGNTHSVLDPVEKNTIQLSPKTPSTQADDSESSTSPYERVLPPWEEQLSATIKKRNKPTRGPSYVSPVKVRDRMKAFQEKPPSLAAL